MNVRIFHFVRDFYLFHFITFQKFDVEQRMELRSLINQFVKLFVFFVIYHSSITIFSRVGKGDFNIEQPPPSKNIVSSLYHKLNPSSSQRRNRHKFGGSDGMIQFLFFFFLPPILHQHIMLCFKTNDFVESIASETDSEHDEHSGIFGLFVFVRIEFVYPLIFFWRSMFLIIA